MIELYSKDQLLIQYLKETVNEEWSYAADVHRPLLLLVCVTGPGLMLENNEQTIVIDKPNRFTVLYLPCMQGRLRAIRPGKVELFVIQFSVEWLLKLTRQDASLTARLQQLVLADVPAALLQEPLVADQLIKEPFYEMLLAGAYAKQVYNLLVKANVMRIWAYVMHLQSLPLPEVQLKHRNLTLAEKARKYLDRLPDKVDYTIVSLAEELGTNETTLKVAFKKLTGTTIHKYYHKKRMEKAEALLKAGKTIGETSKLIGYSQLSHFSYIYKKQYGISPSKIYK
ncbi:AraC-type DNA-binding protein [Filimonas lacunae]|uniref:AraC-type DNA-binding protein n=1 Tax=Filimonas lacunae TaxID=477680 RepID=A0A173MD30_9BACT|nr:helix-turn-helix transcriptional regulator [Filimonas lacunae]BAV05494.1 transcriptional regulator, AraC family [Filimonas lacunae]SIT20736.1 AraC-type DNA-binding protein [Filimonas lacunae]